MSFKIGDMKCIARTLGFLESLDNLVKNLYDNKNINISTSPTCRHMFGAHMDLLCSKRGYPYEWVDGMEKLDYEGIPPLEAFHSRLKKTRASDMMMIMMIRSMK